MHFRTNVFNRKNCYKFDSKRYSKAKSDYKPIRSVLVANRGEIAVRVFRACKELKIRSVAIYSDEDRAHLFRLKADESYLVGEGLPPVQAYLSIPDIIDICKRKNIDAVHPGIGFLAERHDFATAVINAGMRFIGPTPEVMLTMGDKVASRQAAIAAGVEVVPGTDGPIRNKTDAKSFCEQHGLPVILKAAYGGGGKGMRVVRKLEEVEENFERASSEAFSAFGDGSMFIERFIERPRHIEVQLLGDKAGNVIHLYERDCSVQRRHQKVIQIAPSPKLDPIVRDKITSSAVKLAKFVKYENAGTCEFLCDPSENFYFIEVNARLQVEHPTTESVTGVDIVKTQIQITEGKTLNEMGLTQDTIKTHGFAIQCAVTTEDPAENFRPDTGRIEVFRAGEGNGIRLDGASGFPGAVITPFYDSLLVKVIALAPSFESACSKLHRSLSEFRVRGVKTNIPFLLNVFSHEIFLNSNVDTHFIDDHPELFTYRQSRNRGQKLLKYMGEVLVNGPAIRFMTDILPSRLIATVPHVPRDHQIEDDLRKVFKEQGPAGFVKAVRNNKALLLMDTTLRDAHQSLLATRVRTYDMLKIAPFIAHNFSRLYSLENWGDATFLCALKYLKECPWERLQQLRSLIPNIPFQMLLRGANGVGYRNYPDNIVFEFCKMAVEAGIDIFRVYDCFNYVPNIIIGIEAAGKAGGVVEAAIAYTGDISNPKKSKYDLNYYLKLADQLVKAGAHVLCVKDMAGLLKPQAAKTLVKALRDKYPDIPLHMHTHDTSGTGIASMLASVEAGADVVDVAVDSMSGTISQPSMGALVTILEGSQWDTKLSLSKINEYSEYWEQARAAYGPFECTEFIKSGSTNVYQHEIPGGQYSNFKFRAKSLGLTNSFDEIKKAYAQANKLLGDIIKITPSSTVVGDLALFMIETGLKPKDIEEKAEELTLPVSVIDYFQGNMGQPPGGFPENLRNKILRDLPQVKGRPGASLPAFDFEKLTKELKEQFPDVTKNDVMSAVFFPVQTKRFLNFREKYGPVDKLDTATYFVGPQIGKEYLVTISEGAVLNIYALAITDDVNSRGERQVFFEFNGGLRNLYIRDKKLSHEYNIHPKAEKGNKKHIGAPMPGIVKEIRVKVGDAVNKGSPLIILTAMKMETVVQSKEEGVVATIHVVPDMHLMVEDLLISLK